MIPRSRVAVIGLGSMGRNHARVLNGSPEFELVAAVDPLQESHKVLPAGVKNLRYLGELEDEEIDYCVIAVPSSLHESIARSVAELGWNALIEKPLSVESDAARRIEEEFHQRGLVCAVGHIERFNPAAAKAFEIIHSGALGSILQISTLRQGPHPGRIMDVGVVLDLATHDLHLTSWLSGSDFSSVYALSRRGLPSEHEGLVSIMTTLNSGAISSHQVNWWSPHKVRQVNVLCQLGALTVDTLRLTLNVHTFEDEDAAAHLGALGGRTGTVPITPVEPLLAEHLGMKKALKGQHEEVVLAPEGRRVVEVAEAVLQSADAGSVVVL